MPRTRPALYSVLISFIDSLNMIHGNHSIKFMVSFAWSSLD